MITIFTKQNEKLYIPSKSIGKFCLKKVDVGVYLTITYQNGSYLWDGYVVQKLSEEEDIIPALADDGIVFHFNEARKEY